MAHVERLPGRGNSDVNVLVALFTRGSCAVWCQVILDHLLGFGKDPQSAGGQFPGVEAHSFVYTKENLGLVDPRAQGAGTE